jgi:hypothetical protein
VPFRQFLGAHREPYDIPELEAGLEVDHRLRRYHDAGGRVVDTQVTSVLLQFVAVVTSKRTGKPVASGTLVTTSAFLVSVSMPVAKKRRPRRRVATSTSR